MDEDSPAAARRIRQAIESRDDISKGMGVKTAPDPEGTPSRIG